MKMISVIITTFNRADYFKKALESVLKQTYRDIEIIILDNDSKDNTEQVAKSYNDKRIKYIKHKPMNIAKARNLGVHVSLGKYIAFLDDDDEWNEDKLERQLEIFNKNNDNICMVYGAFQWVSSENKIIRSHTPKIRGRILKDLLLQKDPFTGSASNPMIMRDKIIEVGKYNEDITTGEDWELYLRLSENNLIDYTQSVVLKIKHHTGTRLCDRLKDAADLEKYVMQRYETVFNNDKRLKSFYLQKIGGKYIRAGHIKEGRRYLIKSIIKNIFNCLAYIQFIISFLPNKIYIKIHGCYRNVKQNI